MAVEIERKFLVNQDKWQPMDEGLLYCQGYIYTINGNTVRVRIAGNKGYLTLKSKAQNMTRSEFEYEIPVNDASEMLEILCDRPLIEKIRYKVLYNQLIWEVDQFLGENEGLILAEVELKSENQDIELPDWISLEVTHDQRYFNSYLAKHPYNQWHREN